MKLAAMPAMIHTRLHLSAAQWQGLCFLAVGACAAMVHECVVVACVEWWDLAKSRANLVGFLMAFMPSYLGHRYLTFANKHGVLPKHAHALPRFFLLACASFILNQCLYVALLTYTPLPYAVALFIVLLSVAVFTFVLGKLWAFRLKQQ